MHTSCGYIFNRDVSGLAEAEADFDAFLETDGVSEFEQRAVIPFPNFVHRRIFDGAVARIGNAASFLEPLEATAIVSAQLQIGMVLHMRLNRSVENLECDAPVVNRFLINNMLRNSLFVGWHYSCGSRYESEFWRYARDHAWPKYRVATDPEAVDCDALRKFDEMLELMNQTVIDKTDRDRMCALPLTSYAQMSQGLGCQAPVLGNFNIGCYCAIDRRPRIWKCGAPGMTRKACKPVMIVRLLRRASIEGI